jgi:hypothetical protein
MPKHSMTRKPTLVGVTPPHSDREPWQQPNVILHYKLPYPIRQRVACVCGWVSDAVEPGDIDDLYLKHLQES